MHLTKHPGSIKLFASITALLTFYLFLSCTPKSQDIRVAKDDRGYVIISHKNITLKISPSTDIEVTYTKDGEERSLVATDEKNARTTHYLVIDGQTVENFELNPQTVTAKRIRSEFGTGQRIALKSQASGPQNSTIEKTLTIDLYEKYPDTAILRTSYHISRSDGPLLLTQVYSDAFQLDRKQVDEQAPSHDFWGFFGFGKTLGRRGSRRVNVLRIESDLNEENDSERVSGVPLNDIWAPEMGTAIACIEKRARILKMPVRVDDRGIVHIAILEEPKRKLASGETYDAVRTAVIVHSLDYYDPLKRYAELMTDQDIKPKPCPEFGYEPFWCNWGYRKDWQLSHGLDRLDEFKALGIKAVTIDDGWFDNYGDWFVSPDRFPEGEQQLIEWVEQLHAAGLKAVFWWVPCIAGPKTVAEHPDWLILDKDGNPVRSNWRGSFMLCPSSPEVLQYHRDLTKRFISEYGFDGFKLDGIYKAPRCYNPAHNHESPDESYSAYEDVFRVLYETAMELRPDGDFILGQCPCGAFCSPYFMQWGNRPVTADPPLRSITTRHRVKAYKALLGATSCVDNDFHETYNDYFPVEVGCGGLVTTKYSRLSDYEFNEFKKWYGLYNKYRLSSGEYLNLYDVGYDVPETYVIKKDSSFFYTFLKPGIKGPENVPWDQDHVDERTEKLKAFETELEQLPLWQGEIELRGLENGRYSVYNLESDEKLGEVTGPIGKLTISFRDHLILRVQPETEK